MDRDQEIKELKKLGEEAGADFAWLSITNIITNEGRYECDFTSVINNLNCLSQEAKWWADKVAAKEKEIRNNE